MATQALNITKHIEHSSVFHLQPFYIHENPTTRGKRKLEYYFVLRHLVVATPRNYRKFEEFQPGNFGLMEIGPTIDKLFENGPVYSNSDLPNCKHIT